MVGGDGDGGLHQTHAGNRPAVTRQHMQPAPHLRNTEREHMELSATHLILNVFISVTSLGEGRGGSRGGGGYFTMKMSAWGSYLCILNIKGTSNCLAELKKKFETDSQFFSEFSL